MPRSLERQSLFDLATHSLRGVHPTMSKPMSRRTAILRLAAIAGAPLLAHSRVFANEELKEIHMLKPGE